MQNSGSESGNTLFPVFLKLENLNLLIIGGGNIALEKLTAIFNNSPNATVKLIAAVIIEPVKDFLIEKNIPYCEKLFEEPDLEGINLAVIAVGDLSASKEIKQICASRNILTNVADTPDLCDFYLGSIVQKGNLKIAISTNGKSPTIAKRIKETLDEALPAEIDQLLSNIAVIRNNLKGDFGEKVKQLNKITETLSPSKKNL